ncbi:MAG TPA: hypothetical protein VKB93_04280 [Thermoanaerobaculia bacterium]|nr:hypothetical protein [Thermoanaerobaculia bacterium]
MKTTLSIPDDAQHSATARNGDEITEQVNAAIEQLGDDELEPFEAQAAKRILEKTEW